MSTCPKLLGSGWLVASLLVLASSFAHGQTVGGDGVGAALASDAIDLEVLGECLRDSQLRSQVDPLLAAGGSVNTLTFARFFESPTGVRIYLGSLSIGARAWSWVHVRPAAPGASPKTYVRAESPPPAHHDVIPSGPGLDFLVLTLLNPPDPVDQAIRSELSLHKLTGVRVTAPASASRVGRFSLELFFDDEDQHPQRTISAEFASGGFSNYSVK